MAAAPGFFCLGLWPHRSEPVEGGAGEFGRWLVHPGPLPGLSRAKFPKCVVKGQSSLLLLEAATRAVQVQSLKAGCGDWFCFRPLGPLGLVFALLEPIPGIPLAGHAFCSESPGRQIPLWFPVLCSGSPQGVLPKSLEVGLQGFRTVALGLP